MDFLCKPLCLSLSIYLSILIEFISYWNVYWMEKKVVEVRLAPFRFQCNKKKSFWSNDANVKCCSVAVHICNRHVADVLLVIIFNPCSSKYCQLHFPFIVHCASSLVHSPSSWIYIYWCFFLLFSRHSVCEFRLRHFTTYLLFGESNIQHTRCVDVRRFY